MQNAEKVQNCKRALLSFLPENFKPKLGLILGTGLGGLVNELENAVRVPFSSLPGYPASTVNSHAGAFCCGFLQNVPVLVQEGRCHLYEGYSPSDVALGVRIMAALGVQTLIITNAAGALNPQFEAGEVMLITDHINYTGQSPLTGLGDEEGRTRFTDMTVVYDRLLRGKAVSAALDLGITLQRGVYVGLNGPQMETPAETRMLRAWGADAVGMSTVMEVIAARHAQLKVLGFSCLSNKNLPDAMAEAPLEEVIEVAGHAAKTLQKLLRRIIPEL